MLTISGDQFLFNNRPFRILSGAMHYFRVPPENWADRLRKLQAMGLNTVETYVAWNLHEPRPGEFHFEGILALERYLNLAAEIGLKAIVRPGPYICSEWDFGGLPAWLLQDPAMRVRCAYPPYLAAVDRFFAELLPRLAPLQASRGGPVIAVQVENEYGSYGNDKTYLRHLETTLRAHGIDVLLFTSDGPEDRMLQFGTLPHILKTVNFGSHAREAFAKLREYQPEGPLMCGEFWNGWFDHWGEAHHQRPAEDAAAALAEILSLGASVNLYMFHGGTNFGLMSGANEAPYPNYQATVTSYDDDAPLNEAGDPTPKYFALREVLRQYTPIPSAIEIAASAPRLALGKVALTETVGFFELLDHADSEPAFATPVASPTPEPMETFGFNTAFILYRTRLAPRSRTAEAGTAERLTLRGLHDRAQIFINGKEIGVLERELHQDNLEVKIPPGGAQLDILVENMGRVNYGPNLTDRKGITGGEGGAGGVLLGQQMLFDWQIYAPTLENISALPYRLLEAEAAAFSTPEPPGPAFYRGSFTVVEQPADTFLALPGWTKGIAWINGFCLGRYWSRGPQQTLYIPAVLLRQGMNWLTIFELHQAGSSAGHPTVDLLAQEILA